MIQLHGAYESRFIRAFANTSTDMFETIAYNGDSGYCIDAPNIPLGGARRIDQYTNSLGELRPAFFISDVSRQE